VSCVVSKENNVTREERSVRPAKIEQHAVVTRDGNDAHAGDARRFGVHALTLDGENIGASRRLISPTMGR
jgi:hypothetical protein